MKKFFQDGELPKEINEAITVLIPKVKQAEELKDFRPTVFPCAMSYSIKLWPINRLRPLLGGLISENQCVFFPGRLITDNALIAFECFHAIQMSKMESSSFCVSPYFCA